MNFQLIYGLIVLITFVLVLSALIIFIAFLPLLIRSLIIKKVAQKYGLNFKSNFRLRILPTDKEELNICEGDISGKHIKIFDSINYKAFSVSPLNKNATISSKKTTIIVNGKEYSILSDSLFSGYSSISSINKAIVSIINNNIENQSTISNDITSQKKLITYFLLILILILIIVFLIYLSKKISV